jgi:predicted AAA+ superfamily ATPase
VLRVLCDRNPLPARFLILGSASPDLLRQSSEHVRLVRRGRNRPGFSWNGRD